MIDKKLLKRIVKYANVQKTDVILEIGAGSGIHLETAKNLGIKIENLFSSDINPASVEHCNVLGFNCIHSDLFEKIPKQKFNLIIFNPPYLPENKQGE